MAEHLRGCRRRHSGGPRDYDREVTARPDRADIGSANILYAMTQPDRPCSNRMVDGGIGLHLRVCRDPIVVYLCAAGRIRRPLTQI